MVKKVSQRSSDSHKTLLLSEQSHLKYARDLFYAALRREAPIVMDEPDQGTCLVQPEQVPIYACSPPERWPDVAPLGSFVERWAKRHHLYAPWVIIDAIEYVLALRNGDFASVNEPKIHSGLSAPAISSVDSQAIVAVIELDLPSIAWHTGTQSRAEIEVWLRQRFEAALKRQLDRWEALAKGGGLSTLDRRELFRDMRWVVRRVVLGQTPATIRYFSDQDPELVDEPPSTERAVQTAIKNGCDLLQLPHPHRGRPKKPRSRSVRVQKNRN